MPRRRRWMLDSPSEQLIQLLPEVAPNNNVDFPGGHSVQSVAPWLLRQDPRMHWGQLDPPPSVLKVTGPQSMHFCSEGMCEELAYCPA